MSKGTLYSVVLLCIVLTLLVSNTIKPGADATTHSDLHDNLFLLDTPTGLSSQTTYTVIKDKQGFVWVSTRNGIDRYDGTTFRHYRLGEQKMRGMRDGMTITLYCDDEGDLWAFTERSLIFRYSAREDEFEEVLSLPNEQIWGSAQALYKYGNLLLVGATDGITCYNLSSHEVTKRFCPDDNIRALIPYHNGQVLFGSQQGIGIIDLRELKGRQTHWVDASVNSLFFDQATNRIWLGGNGNGLYVVDPEQPEAHQSVSGTEGNVISQICRFGNRMLFGVDGGGLWAAELNEKHYVERIQLMASDTPDAPHQLKSSTIRSVLVDDNNIWIAMYIGGIAHMQPPTPLLQLSNTKANAPSDMFAQGVNTDADGNIWIAFEQAIACFDHDGHNPRYYLDHEAHFLTVQPAQDGTVWCGGYNTGLFHFNPRTGWKEHFTSIVGQNVKDCVYAIKEDRKGDIWVGGLNFPLTRMHRTDDGSYDTKSYEGVTLVTDFDWITPDSIAVGTTDGLYIIDTATDSIYHMLNKMEEWSGTNFMSAVVPRQGHEVWLATQGAGIICYDLTNKKNPVTAYGLDNGLPSLELRGMELLNDTILCISTEGNGIFAFDCVRRIYQNSLRHSDGLQNSLFLQASSTHDSQNRIIFGGDQGAVVVKPTDLLTDLHNFNIYVVGKGVFDNKATLPYHARNLDIEFTTNDIYHQSEYNFYYRIKGITDEWQTIDKSRHVRFAQLPAGEYDLEIRAVGAANQSSSLTINVIAEQEPWLRWYAILGYIIVVVLLTTIMTNILNGLWKKARAK